MIPTLDESGNGISLDFDDNLYNKEKLKAIIRFSRASIPVYARITGYGLLVAGQGENFANELKIDEIAELNMVSRSATIHALKLLVELNIFHKQEHINKPCIYTFNCLGDWIEYSPPEPKNKVTHIYPSVESSASDVCSVPEISQEEKGMEVVKGLFDPIVENVESTPETPGEIIWRTNNNDTMSNRYWTTGPIYDEKSGLEVQRRVNQEGLLPHQVVIEAVQLSKGFKFLTAIATVADGICTGALSIVTDAIAKLEQRKVRKQQRRKNSDVVHKSRLQEREQRQEAWYKENRHLYGYDETYPYNLLPVVNSERCLRIDGKFEQVRELMQTSNHYAYAM